MTEETAPKTHLDYLLPPSVVSRIDLSRLVSEVEWVDNEVTSAAVRAKTGQQAQASPPVSDTLREFLLQNKIKFDTSNARTHVVKQLRLLKDKAPVIHMTFAVPADTESLQKLAAWLRTSVHKQALISVGIQPALVAGVYMRTPNHVHDLSVRGILEGRHDLLVQELKTLHNATPADAQQRHTAAESAPAVTVPERAQ